MIGISKLYCGTIEASDPLRYGRLSQKLPSHLLQFSKDKKPVVVWNTTRACNLKCRHCYAQATAKPAEDELTLEEGLNFIDSLADFGSPVLLFSGGEPLMHPHIFTLIARAREKGLRAVLSTNGLLIDENVASKLKDLDLSYVGVSLDGLRHSHDVFRRKKGAFDGALKAMEIAKKHGLKVGLRLTLNHDNALEIDSIFDLIKKEGIDRVCFYHLVDQGQDSTLKGLGHQQTRKVVDQIIDRTWQFHQNNNKIEVLTVDNHADGAYLYLRMKKENNPRAAEVLKLLRLNGGNSSGLGIGAVSWNGLVHPDQFWRRIILGSIKEKPFAEIWQDPNNELLQSLKNKKEHVTGRCKKCVFLDICGGNLRARAHYSQGDIWAVDPACYLTDKEISEEIL